MNFLYAVQRASCVHPPRPFSPPSSVVINYCEDSDAVDSADLLSLRVSTAEREQDECFCFAAKTITTGPLPIFTQLRSKCTSSFQTRDCTFVAFIVCCPEDVTWPLNFGGDPTKQTWITVGESERGTHKDLQRWILLLSNVLSSGARWGFRAAKNTEQNFPGQESWKGLSVLPPVPDSLQSDSYCNSRFTIQRLFYVVTDSF